MGKYQNLIAIRPTTYRRFQAFYDEMAEPKASRTAIISEVLENWLSSQGATADPYDYDPAQLDLFDEK